MNRYASFLLIYIHLFRCFKVDDRQVLQQKITGNGFHRTLRYNVMMQIMEENCSYMIVQRVPVNFYVDMDELQNLEAFGGPNVVTESAIDTEQPSYSAKEHILYIHPTVYKKHSSMMLFEVWLPIHVRYQRPVASGSKVILSFENGRLYSNCSTTFQAEEQLIDSRNGSCAGFDNSKWRFLHEFAKTKEGSSVKVPTGNTDYAISVTVITLLTTSMSSLMVLRIALRC